MTHTHTVSNNRVKEPTNQTILKVKAMRMGPLQMWSHGTINTLLDGKQSSGTLKRKDICLLDKVISLFFLPLCVVCHTARFFFCFVHYDRILQPYGPICNVKTGGEFGRHFSLHQGTRNGIFGFGRAKNGTKAKQCRGGRGRMEDKVTNRSRTTGHYYE